MCTLYVLNSYTIALGLDFKSSPLRSSWAKPTLQFLIDPYYKDKDKMFCFASTFCDCSRSQTHEGSTLKYQYYKAATNRHAVVHKLLALGMLKVFFKSTLK